MNVDGGVGSSNVPVPTVSSSMTNLDAFSYQPEKAMPHTTSSRYEYPQSHSTFARPWQTNDWVKPVENNRSPSYNSQDVASPYFNGNSNFSNSAPTTTDHQNIQQPAPQRSVMSDFKPPRMASSVPHAGQPSSIPLDSNFPVPPPPNIPQCEQYYDMPQYSSPVPPYPSYPYYQPPHIPYNTQSQNITNMYSYPTPPKDATEPPIPQTPESLMPPRINTSSPNNIRSGHGNMEHDSNSTEDLKQPDDVPELATYEPSWEIWEMFKKDAKLTELFPGHRSKIRRILMSCKQNMREAIIKLSNATKLGPHSSKGQHSKLLMDELNNISDIGIPDIDNMEKREERPHTESLEPTNPITGTTEDEIRKQQECLEFERLMELYDNDKAMVEKALQVYREERAAAAAEAKNAELAAAKKRKSRAGKFASNEEGQLDPIMPPKWCTTARTRAKANTRTSSSLHMSDVIRDDATLAALGIPISDEETDDEKDKKKVSVGLRRPPTEDDEDYEDSGSEKDEEDEEEYNGSNSGDDSEVEKVKHPPPGKAGWFGKRKRGNVFSDDEYAPARASSSRRRQSDDDFVVGSDEGSEAVSGKHSEESEESVVSSDDSGEFGAKSKKKVKKLKAKQNSRKRKSDLVSDGEDEEASLVKTRGVRASKATKDYSEFFKKQKLEAAETNEVDENGVEVVVNNDSELSEEIDESSEEYQASSDPEEYDVGKKAKNKAKAAKAARIKAIRDARDQRRKMRKTSSDEDPDFNPKRKAKGTRKRKGVINDDSDEDFGDDDFRNSQTKAGGVSDEDSDRPFDYNLTKDDKHSITEFFNEASPFEIQLVPGLSKKKADMIASLRPFDSWINLVSKFKSEKGLNENLLADAKSVLDQQTTLTVFLKKCEKIAEKIEQTVRSLQNKDSVDEDAAEIQIVTQPQLLNKDFKLKPYQIIGVNWLYVMFKHNTNAVLSDEMGLGKTIQTIAFLAYLKENDEVTGKHMIVAPASTLENWAREFTDWCPSLKLFLYYGSQEERSDLRRRALMDNEDFEVLITTYNVCISNKLDRSFFKKINIQYMVIDEGHMLRNMGSIRYQQLMRIQADSRLLLTGTPLQNNLVELVSVLTFVMPTLFAQHIEAFKTHFQAYANKSGSNGDDDTSSFELARIEQAKLIMKPFMLRRLKRDVIKQLPPKKEIIVKCQMNEAQRDCYNEIKLTLVKKLKDKQEGVGQQKDNKSLSNAMMQLRKATNHKLLHRRHYNVQYINKIAKMLVRTERFENSEEHLVIEDLTVMSDFEIHLLCQESAKTRKFCLPEEEIVDSAKIAQLDKLLPAIKEKGEKILLFSQFVIVLDILQEYLAIRKHKFIRLDGSTSVEQRLLMIDEFNKSASEDCFVFLLSTRAGGLGINLASANHVIIHDIDFNPYNDKQAEDRAHRVGQEKEVTVYRLIVENSIDEGMLAIAEEKLKLEENLSSGGGMGANSTNNIENDVATLLENMIEQHQ